MSVRLGPILITTEGILLASALVLFLAASHRRLRGMQALDTRQIIALLAFASLCGVIGAALYGIPGTLATMHADSELPLRGAIAFGSFGGYWGVLLGGWGAARAMRQRPLPILDAIVPAILLGGALARTEVLFQFPPVTGPVAAWALCDIAAQTGIALVIMLLERRRPERTLPPGTAVTAFLLVYGAARFVLECFRSEFPILETITWGQTMSAVQITAGVALLAWFIFTVLRRRSAP